MEKTIGAFDVRRHFGSILQHVATRGDRYVVERHGEPVAVVVPVAVYEQWKQARQQFFDELRGMAEEADLPAREAQELARRESEEVRHRRA